MSELEPQWASSPARANFSSADTFATGSPLLCSPLTATPIQGGKCKALAEESSGGSIWLTLQQYWAGRMRGIAAQGDATDSLLLLCFLVKPLERQGLPPPVSACRQNCQQLRFLSAVSLLTPGGSCSRGSPVFVWGKCEGVAASEAEARFPWKSSWDSCNPSALFMEKGPALGTPLKASVMFFFCSGRRISPSQRRRSRLWLWTARQVKSWMWSAERLFITMSWPSSKWWEKNPSVLVGCAGMSKVTSLDGPCRIPPTPSCTPVDLEAPKQRLDGRPKG